MTQQCYRPEKSYYYSGLFSGIIAFCLGSSSTYAALFNIDGSFPRPVLFALYFAVFWSLFFSGCIWCILYYKRHRLIFSKTEICSRGLFIETSLAFDDISELNWRGWTSDGTIIIKSNSTKIKIKLNVYPSKNRYAIVSILRNMTSADNQNKWDQFTRMLSQYADVELYSE